MLIGLAAVALAAARPLPAEILREGPMEKQPLFPAGTAKAWLAAESGIEETNARTKSDAFAWHWHVTVDYQRGELKYPIGWPRISRTIPAGAARDWSGWDFLRMWVYTTTSRPRLPAVPVGLGLHMPDRAGAYNRTLSELEKDEWVEIRIPLAQVPRHHDVRQVQFHIAESNYRDGDQLDLYFADVALLRYATPTLLSLAPEQAVVFEDARGLAVVLEAVGIKPGEELPVSCELRRPGGVVARMTAPVSRGRHRLLLEPVAGALSPGTYELQAAFAGERSSVTANVRVVESPWRNTR